MHAIGFNPADTWTSTDPVGSRPVVGTRFVDEDGDEYVFVGADGAGVAAARAVVIKSDFLLSDLVETTLSAPGQFQGFPIGVSVSAIPANGFGWLCIKGTKISLLVGANCVKGTLLNTTGTAGLLDDDATAGSERISGLVIDTTNGGSNAAQPATFQYPFIAQTL